MEQLEHRPLRSVGDVVAVVRELLDRIELDEADALERIAEAAPQGRPRASGAPSSGGATNRLHDFATGLDGTGVSIPQHSDPVGETVAWEAEQSPDMPNLRRAYDNALVMMRAAEACRSHLVSTNRREQMRAEDRSICALCLDAGYTTDLGAHGRDSNAGGRGPHKPRCRWHLDFVTSHGRDATLELTIKHCRGDRIYYRDIERALGTNATRKSKNKRRKARRR